LGVFLPQKIHSPMPVWTAPLIRKGVRFSIGMNELIIPAKPTLDR
jgi:hypothetical protein